MSRVRPQAARSGHPAGSTLSCLRASPEDRRVGARPRASAQSRTGSQADDVFAFGFGGAKPGRAGDVTTRSRVHHSNKQTVPPPLLCRARDRPPERPHKTALLRTSAQRRTGGREAQ